MTGKAIAYLQANDSGTLRLRGSVVDGSTPFLASGSASCGTWISRIAVLGVASAALDRRYNARDRSDADRRGVRDSPAFGSSAGAAIVAASGAVGSALYGITARRGLGLGYQ